MPALSVGRGHKFLAPCSIGVMLYSGLLRPFQIGNEQMTLLFPRLSYLDIGHARQKIAPTHLLHIGEIYNILFHPHEMGNKSI
jgi:hypothetical protein